MLNRNAPLVVCLALISGVAYAQNPQGVGYAVEFASSASGQFQVFPENTATFATSSIGNTGPSGTSQIVAKPDGTKFYIVGSSGLDSIDPAFTTPKTINGLTGTFSRAVISPDGRYLFLTASQGSGSGTVYMINTSNDSVVLTQPVSGTVIGVVVSRDSSTAWILGESSGTFITTINVTNQQQSGTPVFLRDPATGGALGGAATTFGLSPLNLLYVTAGNEILEVNPAILQTCQASPLTCAPATVISVNATPGPLQFTPDGAFAYFLNQTPGIGGQTLLRMALPSHSIITYSAQEAFDGIYVAGQNRIFAHSPSDTTLWDVASDLSTVTVSTLQSVLPATGVYSVALSDEVPSAQFLFVTAGGPSLSNIYMVNLSTNSVSGQAATSLGFGPLEFVYVPSQNPSGFTTPLTYNSTQIVQPGATAAPLIARILDQNGNPVFAVPVTFTGDTSLTISPPNTTTNADGYVQASVKVGSNPGSFPVTMTAGTGNTVETATFSLTIPGPTGGNGGTGTGSGPNQLSIVTGNAQLFQAGVLRLGAPNNSLTVLLVDTKGNPLPNQNITFAVTGPQIGVVGTPNATTDVNGMANTTFFPGYPPQNIPFEATTVTATATDVSGDVLGAVNFTETMYQNNFDGTGAPTVLITQPSNTLTLTGGEGDVIPMAIQAVVYDGAFGKAQPIPGIGIRIADATNPNLNGPGTCRGNPVSDQNGIINCDFIPACPATLAANGLNPGLGLHGFDIDVGEYEATIDFGVIITPGTMLSLSIPSNGGNNQNASPGSQLPLALTATATDGCGTPVSGVTVTWKVTQGSATLASPTSVTGTGGFASTKVTLGSSSGTTTITATINGTTTVTYTETANAVIGSLSLVSGGGQSALVGAPFGSPLVFALKDSKNNALTGLTVNFSLAGGSATLSATSAVTNSLGQVSVNVTAGNAPGNVTVNASYGTFSATASLTVSAKGPSITASSFVNAASLQPGLVPCGLATVTGAGLASGVNGIVSGNTLGIGPLNYTVAGVSISVNGSSAPILSVSNQGGVQQVNFQTPCEVTPTSSGVVSVTVSSATTQVSGITIYPTQPGIFTYAGPGSLAYGWIISAKDGSYLTPSNLAHAGQTYYLVATGLGQTTPNAVTNAPGTGSQVIPVSQVTLAINNVGVPVSSVQYVEGAVGEYIITFTIPTPFASGTNLPIELGGLTSNGQTIFDNSQVALPGIN